MNLAKRLDRLEDLIKRRVSAGPIYFSRHQDEEETVALNRLVAEGRITEAAYNRVEFIVRRLIAPPDVGPAPELGDFAATPAIATAGRDEEASSRRFNRPLDYPELGVL